MIADAGTIPAARREAHVGHPVECLGDIRSDGLGLVWASLAMDLVALPLLVTALRRRRAR